MLTIKKISPAYLLLIFLALSGCSSMHGKTWIPGWKETSSLSIQRAGAAVVVEKDIIYLIGGVDGWDFMNTTEYARIQKDGSLSPWQPGSMLNEARGFTEAVVHNGFIYVVGGGNGPNGHNLLHTVERARILPDGSLGPWIMQSEMVVGRRCSKAVATDKKIYSFGGFGGVMLDSVESVEFRPDGSLGEWKLEPEVMTMMRYINSVKKVGDIAYVIGGHDQDKGVGITDVERSQLDKAGVLQKWQATTPMQVGRYAHSTAVHNDYMYAMGGLTGAEYLDSIERTKLDKSGELGAWQITTPLTQPRANFSVVHHNNYIYVLGGANNDGYLTSVEYATANEAGDIGYWGSNQEAEAFKTRLAAIKAQRSQLPNAGTVKEVIQAQAYTYLRVIKNDGSTEWIAGPKVDIPVNASVRYSKGVSMPDFYSKELQRNFAKVLFVGQVQKAE